jgi:hypothetical protein
MVKKMEKKTEKKMEKIESVDELTIHTESPGNRHATIHISG